MGPTRNSCFNCVPCKASSTGTLAKNFFLKNSIENQRAMAGRPNLLPRWIKGALIGFAFGEKCLELSCRVPGILGHFGEKLICAESLSTRMNPSLDGALIFRWTKHVLTYNPPIRQLWGHRNGVGGLPSMTLSLFVYLSLAGRKQRESGHHQSASR